jgi:hypothetical protein
MRLGVAAIVCVAAACQSDNGSFVRITDSGSPDVYVACPRNKTSQCNPLTQSGCAAGEKCTWLLDAVVPQYIGHIGCAPMGARDVGESCMYGPPGCDGYDDCKKGFVCGDYRGGEGVCKQLCDQQGGFPMCDAQHSCVTHSGLFSTGETTPSAAGVCDIACDPLTDNDFDGSGSASTKSTTTCGADPNVGCYGYPSFGTPPKTAWSCSNERNPNVAQPIGLRHRVQCTTANACVDSIQPIRVESCNQGYLPLLRESATVSTVICVALCKPKNCYAGNCGPNDENRLGEAPHRCMNPDRVGTFDTSAGGEHCRFMWSFERDELGDFLPSSSSNTLGFCFDHAKYGFPPCASLPDGFGSGSALGAGDVGCVDTTHVQLATGKPKLVDDLRPLITPRYFSAASRH